MAPHLTSDQIHKLFPFHFMVDGNLQIVQVGRSLLSLFPELRPGRRFLDFLSVIRPSNEVSIQSLIHHSDEWYVLEGDSGKVILAGKFVTDQEQGGFLFLGSRWQPSPQALNDLEPNISDVSRHDLVPSIQQMFNSQGTTFTDVSRLADRFSLQQAQLRQINQALQQEIAARRLIEASLRDEQLRYRAIIDDIKEVLFRTDLLGAWTFLNRAWNEITGFEIEASLGTCSLEYVHEEDRERHREKSAKLLSRQKELVRYEVRYLTRDGGVRWMEVFARLSVDANGITDGISGTMIEVTHRHRAEEMFRAVFKASPHAQLIVDEDGIIDCNVASLSMIGASARHDLLTASLPLISCEIQPDGRRASEKLREMEQLARTKGCHKFEWLLRRADSSTLTVEFTMSPMEMGGKQAMLAVWHDLTGTMRLAAELRRLKEAAEEANRSKSDLLSAMSDEIRTPLNGVIGMTGLLLEGELSGKQRGCAEAVRTAGESLLTIVNEVLEYARIEAGKLVIKPTRFDMVNTIEDVADSMQPKAEARGIELVVRYAPGTPRAFIGDSARWRQVLLSLAENSIKFTANGHVLIEVSCQDSSGDSAQLCVTVADAGMGMTEAVPSLIDGEDAQPDGSEAQRFGGAALGLTISRRLTEMMGGRLSLQGSSGSKTRFRIDVRLPLDPNPQVPTTAPTISDTRCLIVDDHPLARRVLGERLGQWHIPSSAAEDGPSALAMLRNAINTGSRFGIVFIDDQMPDGEGLALADAIASDVNLGSPLLVALTSRIHSNPLQAKSYPLFAAALSKPLRQLQLLQTLNSLAARPGSPSPTLRSDSKTLEADPEWIQCVRIKMSEPNPTQPLNNQTIDLGGALKRVDGDHALLQLLAKSFLKTGPQLIERISGAITTRDPKKLATAAHTLKGSAALFDAHTLVRTAENVETAAKAENWDAILSETDAIRSTFQAVEQALQSLLHSPAIKA